MTKLITTAASGLARRTSRRGFLGRTARLMIGVVGGSALLSLMASPAMAEGTSRTVRGGCACRNPCLAWATCSCGPDGARTLDFHWHCPGCGNYRCEYYRCSTRRCG